MALEEKLQRLFEIGRHPLRLTGRSEEIRDGFVLETLRFVTAAGEPVQGLLTRPESATGPRSAILYIHAHGHRYDIGASELIDGRDARQATLAFAARHLAPAQA